MQVIKHASGKTTLKISQREWVSIGVRAGWIKNADLSSGDIAYPPGSQLSKSGDVIATLAELIKTNADALAKDVFQDRQNHTINTAKNLIKLVDLAFYTANKPHKKRKVMVPQLPPIPSGNVPLPA